MGVIYVVSTLTPEIREYLDDLGVTNPPGDSTSRYPTPREIRSALSQMPQTTVRFDVPKMGDSWGAEIDGSPALNPRPWTQLNLSHYRGEDEPTEISFSKGWPEIIVAAVREIARFTGPLVICPDTGENPVVVCGNSHVGEVLYSCEHARQASDQTPNAQ